MLSIPIQALFRPKFTPCPYNPPCLSPKIIWSSQGDKRLEAKASTLRLSMESSPPTVSGLIFALTTMECEDLAIKGHQIPRAFNSWYLISQGTGMFWSVKGPEMFVMWGWHNSPSFGGLTVHWKLQLTLPLEGLDIEGGWSAEYDRVRSEVMRGGYPDLLNVTNFTTSGFQEGQIYAKNCVNLVNIDITTNCRNF